MPLPRPYITITSLPRLLNMGACICIAVRNSMNINRYTCNAYSILNHRLSVYYALRHLLYSWGYKRVQIGHTHIRCMTFMMKLSEGSLDEGERS